MKIMRKSTHLSLAAAGLLAMTATAALSQPCGEAVEHVRITAPAGMSIMAACRKVLNIRLIVRARGSAGGTVVCTVFHSDYS